jgi:hypothetical protein
VHRKLRRLTPRLTTGPATAGCLGPAWGTRYIFPARTKPSRRIGPVNSNVMPHSQKLPLFVSGGFQQSKSVLAYGRSARQSAAIQHPVFMVSIVSEPSSRQAAPSHLELDARARTASDAASAPQREVEASPRHSLASLLLPASTRTKSAKSWPLTRGQTQSIHVPSSQVSRVGHNTSLNHRTRYGGLSWPGLGYAVHFPSPGQAIPPQRSG